MWFKQHVGVVGLLRFFNITHACFAFPGCHFKLVWMENGLVAYHTLARDLI
jgi:hypothetical protein